MESGYFSFHMQRAPGKECDSGGRLGEAEGDLDGSDTYNQGLSSDGYHLEEIQGIGIKPE